MPMTKDQGQMLATLAIACRPVGAPRWDHAGVMAALAKVAHLSLADVMSAVARAASDRTATTPAVIAATNSLHWREKVAESVRPHPPKRDEQCKVCGYHLDRCICGNQATKPTPAAAPQTVAEALAAARAAITQTNQEAS